MTFDNVTDMRIGSKNVKEAWLNGKQVYPSKKRIMDSMVLWYDLKRQGATNESMAANPVLEDLSGNGRHATCYNFAWTEDSGISTVNYPNALVFDGVDDKCNSQSFQMDNFAFFLDLDFISNEQDHSSGVYKPNNFNVYYRKYNTLNIFLNGNNTTNVLQRNDIFYLDSQGLVVFKDGTTDNIPTENYEGHAATPLILNGTNNGYIQFAFRRMLLFNRVLTLEEVEWVKNNLIEAEQ